MVGLDTNVLVRYLVQDDRDQAERATACIEEAVANGEGCFVDMIVLSETVWVLDAAYGFAKGEIVDTIEKILITRQFEVEQQDLVRQALHEYRRGKGDIADYLIGRLNQAYGCDVTVTFDRSLESAAGFEVLH